MTVYIAGPMRGIARYNFPAFDAAAAVIRARGDTPINPADLDRAAGFDAALLADDSDWFAIPDGFSFAECVTRDIESVRKADAMVLLPGWQASKGACAERALAEWLGKTIEDWTPASAEVRVVDPATGGAKGSKPARFDLLPYDALWQVAELYGKGAEKYEARNWEKGYAWHLSLAALHRHLALFWQHRERTDPQPPGCHHMASVVFHALALLAFDLRGIGTDDRPQMGGGK